MSRGVLAIVAAACLAGGVGLWMVTSDEDETVAETETERPRGKKKRAKRRKGDSPAARDGSLDDRVEQLEDEVAALRRELKTMKMRGAAAPRIARSDDDSRDASDESPAFEGAVRDIIEADRAEAMERRTDALRDRFADRRSETLDELVAATGLNKSQRESIDALWETESEQLVPMFVAAREGERPFSEVREEADRIRTATDASVEEMLSPEQYETYKEMRPGPPRRGGRGDRGGRGGGPPPN
ncbi:MAG: hypothetical protein AAGA54_13465 [Myxococcota bacterium]